MSTGELLKHVKNLPDRERQKLISAILTLEEQVSRRQSVADRRVKWPDLEARARRIFGDRVLPNLVLMEREEQSS